MALKVSYIDGSWSLPILTSMCGDAISYVMEVAWELSRPRLSICGAQASGLSSILWLVMSVA